MSVNDVIANLRLTSSPSSDLALRFQSHPTHYSLSLYSMVGFFERNFSQIRAQNRKADVIQLGQVISDENASCLTLNWNKTGPDTGLARSRAGGQWPCLRSQEHSGRSNEVKEM